jgi:hypothetical protein
VSRSQNTFQKRQREYDKKQKQEEKRQRKLKKKEQGPETANAREPEQTADE